MTRIDERLRDSLHSHAADAPDGAHLLAAVHLRSRRIGIRRAIVAGVATVATVAGLAVAVPATGLFRGDDDGGSATMQTATGDSPSKGRITLVKATAQLSVSFPLTPTWSPAGLTSREISKHFHITTLTLRKASKAGQALDGLSIDVEVSPTEPDPVMGGVDPQTLQRQSMRLGGKDGEFRSYARSPGWWAATYQRKTGQWVSIQVSNTRFEAATGAHQAQNRFIDYPKIEQILQQVADGLVDRPLTQPVQVAFTLLPRGFAVAHTNRLHAGSPTGPGVMFRRSETVNTPQTDSGSSNPDLPARTESFGVEVMTDLTDLNDRRYARGEVIQAGDREYTLRTDPAGFTLETKLAKDKRLTVSTPGMPHLSREDAIRFAAGISIKR